MAQPLTTGNASGVSLATVLTATKSFLVNQKTVYGSLKQSLFGLNADGSANAGSVTGLDWNPSHDSTFFTVLDGSRNMVVLPSNWSYSRNNTGNGQTLAVAGTNPAGTARYAAFGGNPIGVPGNAAMDKFLQNTVAWLTKRNNFSNFKVVTAHLPGKETYWWPHEVAVRNWLAASYPGVTVNGSSTNLAAQADNLCDGSKLDACLQGADLLVIGRDQGPAAYDGAAVMQAVVNAQARGIPILYLHHYRDANDLAARMLDYFGLAVSNNYWDIYGLKSFNPSTLPAASGNIIPIQALVSRLDQGNFTSSWSGCTGDRVDCSTDPTYMSEFGSTADAIRTSLRALDEKSVALFSRPDYQMEKLLVLLGDKYRETVSYPMGKLSGGTSFYRAYFSDMAAYMTRSYSSVAKNLGTFSNLIPSSTPVLPTQTVSVTLPQSGTRDYMTGLYVMPGRTVKLTRTDAGAGAVKFGVNMLRDSTWVFNEPSGLERPTRLASARPALSVGQTVTITSPYGGPLYLFVDAAGGAQTATVQMSGVISHPVLRNANDAAEVAAFSNDVLSTPTNWVGITTDTLTLHSTLDKFKQSSQAYNNDMAKLVADTWTYMIKDTYELAGFNSASGQYTLSANVRAFCQAKGWDCTGLQHRRDVMQHVIADKSSCGYGCSGNPYDQSWAFEPLGWGESHEIGHGLQKDRLKIYGARSGEVSNNVYPMHKQIQFNQSASGMAKPIVARAAGAGKKAFGILQAGLASATPVATVYNAMWVAVGGGNAANNDERVMFYRQLMEFARYYKSPSFSDGWELFTLLSLLDRNIDASASTWSPALASSYGFGNYATAPTAIDGNDFMVMASSFIIGRDMRPVFDLWGITYSATASAQVAAYGLSPAASYLFPMDNLTQIPAKVGAPVVMTTSAVYPAGY